MAQRGLWPCKEGSDDGGGNPLFCSTESLPVAFIISFVDVYSDLEPGLPAIPVTAVLVVRWLFYQRVSLCADAARHGAQPGCRLTPNKRAQTSQTDRGCTSPRAASPAPAPQMANSHRDRGFPGRCRGSCARPAAYGRAGQTPWLGMGRSLAGGEQTSAQANALGVCPAGFASCADHMWLCFTACLSPSCLFSP